MKKYRLLSVLVVMLLLGFSGMVKADLNEGLVAYYPFNGDASDESDNDNHGMVNGSILTEDRFGNPDSAYLFDGEDNYIKVLNSNSIEPEEVTVSLWVKGSEFRTFQYILTKGGDACSAGSYAIYTGDNKGISFYIYNGQRYYESSNGGSSIWEDEWHHIVGSFDKNLVKFYVDGAEILNSQSITTSINYLLSNNDLYFGNYPGNCVNYHFSGQIDDIRIYNRMLVESEILQLYNENSCSESCSQAELDAQYQAGRHSCIDNPESCGLITNNNEPCTQVITYGQVPNVDCWVMFPTPCDVPDGWQTTNEEPNVMCGSCDNQPHITDDNCATFDIFSNTLHVPCFNAGSSTYWLDWELTGSDPVSLELKDIGSN